MAELVCSSSYCNVEENNKAETLLASNKTDLSESQTKFSG